ncbi:hypothetical protein GCM10028857_21410 [Salinarchaeum chitinilyticum]
MTVCVTGDVHHMSLGTRDQEYMDRTEVEVAIEYAEIAAEYDVPVTLFCTGKCAVEEPDRMRELAAMENVEIGGHNFYAFDTVVHKGWRGLAKVTGGRVGSWNGPRRFQSWEIGKTIAAFEELGIEITSWRDHAYRHDGRTASLLAEHEVTHFSDARGPDERLRREDGLTVVPINTPPDHEHVFHAFRQPDSEAVRTFEGPFGSESMYPDDWTEWVLEHVNDVRDTATVLGHPACLWLADEFESFTNLCQTLRNRESVQMRDIGVAPAGRGGRSTEPTDTQQTTEV